MGSSLIVVIEYDDSQTPTAATATIPFSGPVEGALDLSGFDDLRFGKDYAFIRAISGFRRTKEFVPLYRLRGLPDNTSPASSRHFSGSTHGVGWLRFSEVIQSLEHASVGLEELSLAVQLVISTMRFLAEKLGDQRVRIVFEIEG